MKTATKETLSPKERKKANLSAIEKCPDLVEAFTLREVFEFMILIAPATVALDAIESKGWDTTGLRNA